MNLQNKVYGKRFCVVSISEDAMDKKPEYIISPLGPGIQWFWTSEELAEYEIDDKIVDDMIKELKKVGDLTYLRNAIGLEPNSGWLSPGLVLKHPKNANILADFRIFSGPTTGYNPITANNQCDIVMTLFYDVDNAANDEFNKDEQEFILNHVLGNHRLGGLGYLDIEDEDTEEIDDKKYEPEEVDVYTDAAPKIYKESSANDYQEYVNNLYESIADDDSFSLDDLSIDTDF